ncbi:outer membrane protein assembly factor BamA [Myxococcota bacterium]|nr:outer membrane protein assembly factor BamA [Myxococcota bacterium]
MSAGLLLAALPVFAQGSTSPGPSEAIDADLPVVAVLPFRVHSAKPIEFLGTSLSNLVRSRLEEGGQVTVVPAEQVDEVLGGRAAEPTSDGAVREIAVELGAGFVVAGSITELAGSYSLDVRLTPAAVGQPSRTRVLTAESDSELLELVDELAGMIRENVLGSASSTVMRVDLDGIPDVDGRLGNQLETTVGQPYDPAAVAADLALLRADTEIASAEVETERRAEGVWVRFVITPARATVAESGSVGPETTILKVSIRGNRRIESDAIRVRIGTRAGQVYSPGRIAADVRAIYALGFFRNVTVSIDPRAEGLDVVFDVEENPVVREISISGNDNVDGEKIRDILTLTTGSTLDYPLLFENRARIAALYRAEGYYLAEVGYEVEPLSEASVAVQFEVDEGKKLKLRKIEFSGNEFFSDRELQSKFSTKTWKFWSYATSWFDRSGTYSEPLFMQDLQSIERMYTDAGFLRVGIGLPVVIPSEDGLSILVEIQEGRRFKVGTLDVAGDKTIDIDALKEMLALSTDEWFNRSDLTRDVDHLTAYYTDRGFYFANVTPLTRLSEESDDVDVTFQVRKGPLYFIRQIDISGNTVTVDPVIRRELTVVEGELYSRRELLLSQGKVDRLGYFEEVDFRPEPTEEPDQLDLQVSVVERPTGSFSFGAGYSSQDGFVVTGSLAQSNLFGRGYGANISVDLGGQTQRFFVSLSDPAFLGSTYSAGLTVYRTSLRFEDFDQQQFGGEVVFGHALSRDNRSRGALRYGISVRQIDDDRQFQAAAVILREVLAEEITSSSVGLNFTRDARNDRFAPTEGYRLAGSLEYAGLGFTTTFARIEARAEWFLGAPSWMLPNSTFVLSSRVGYALPLNSIDDFNFPAVGAEPADCQGQGGTLDCRTLDQIDTNIRLPLSERYFLGGLGIFQLRGFRQRSVGPRRTIISPVGTANSGWYTPAGGNQFDDTEISQFANLDATDVIGGNKFISSSFEYRFPISETVGLQGVAFIDAGNAFAEGQNLFDIPEWRYGTGAGVQWFSPFGPLAVVLGWPLDPLEIETSPVFEFSVGGGAF